MTDIKVTKGTKALTHYDTLKVTQDAPLEVISAAYKALARIYHPDQNGSSPEAMVIMQNLNVAYKILSDPLKRSEHDLWIRSAERREDSSDKSRRRTAPASAGGDKAKAEKAAAEAAKWTNWADKTKQEAEEAQTRAEKAKADLAKAKEADRAKWEVWVTKTAQEAKEAKERYDKAAAQATKAVAEALAAADQAQSQKSEGK